jgi:hypothetical protein
LATLEASELRTPRWTVVSPGHTLIRVAARRWLAVTVVAVVAAACSRSDHVPVQVTAQESAWERTTTTDYDFDYVYFAMCGRTVVHIEVRAAHVTSSKVTKNEC